MHVAEFSHYWGIQLQAGHACIDARTYVACMCACGYSGNAQRYLNLNNKQHMTIYRYSIVAKLLACLSCGSQRGRVVSIRKTRRRTRSAPLGTRRRGLGGWRNWCTSDPPHWPPVSPCMSPRPSTQGARRSTGGTGWCQQWLCMSRSWRR